MVSNIKKDSLILAQLTRMISKVERSFIPITLLRAVLQTAIPLINVIMPAQIIDEILGEARWNIVIAYVLIMAGGNAVFGFLRVYLDRQWDLSNRRLQHGMEVQVGRHIMELDYEKIENPDILDLKERAMYPIKMQNSLNELIETVCVMLTILLSLFSLGVILLQTNVVLLAGILFFCGIQFLLLGRIQKNLNGFYEKIPVTMRKSAYYENIASDYKPLKEIQMYQAKELLLDKLRSAHQDNVNLFASSFSKNGVYEGLMGIVTQTQLVFVYAYNVLMLLENRISLGDFTMHAKAASSFAENILSMVRSIVVIHQDCRYLEVYLEFMNLQPEIESKEEVSPNDGELTIEFRNVSYHYPNKKDMVLQNVSVVIHPGEKISVVGVNGAGKTTFIKLFCRLLTPTEGGIYLNGVNINCYSAVEYQKLIATVFQDFKLFSFSIRDNIDIGRAGSSVEHAVHQAGLEEWIQKYPSREATQVTRRFYEDGVEPSGGEGQKLAIARAIQKDSPIMLLDEPTAALDPYTEYEIYRKFDQMSEGKTVIYISHRLGCCQLCDRILVFEKGQIAEQGSHEELKNAGGRYAKLWEAQAKYYVGQ